MSSVRDRVSNIGWSVLERAFPYSTLARQRAKAAAAGIGLVATLGAPETDELNRLPWSKSLLGPAVWDLVVWIAVVVGVLGKTWLDAVDDDSSLSASQIITGIFGSIVLFLALRKSIVGGSIVRQLLWAIAFGYGGGAIGGDLVQSA